MKPLRQYVRDVQLLEAQATEKTGQRFLMIDWTEFFSKRGDAYIDLVVKRMEIDIAPEVLMGAVIGRKLSKVIEGVAR